MRWPARSAVVLLTAVAAALSGAAEADGAGVAGERVLPSAMPDRLDRLALSPSVSIVAELNGVFCTSSRNCWAVGAEPSGNMLVDEILHWNGQKWASYTFPWVRRTKP